MDYAIDRHENSHGVIVHAIEFSNLYIPPSSDRFRCPVCREPLVLRQGRVRAIHFAHRKKNEQTPLCEERVDSLAGDWFENNRKPLALFLQEKPGNNFNLAIGFPPLGNNLLDYLAKESCKLHIHYDSSTVTYSVNRQYFYSDKHTFLEVKELPADGSPLLISWNPAKSVLNVKWGQSCSGFGNYSLAFNPKNCFKQIREDSCFLLDYEYYIITKNGSFTSDFNNFPLEEKGLLHINNYNYRVIQFSIPSSLISDFEALQCARKLVRKHFNLELANPKLKVTPLWPPTVQKENIFTPLFGERLFLSLGNSINSIEEVTSNYQCYEQETQLLVLLSNYRRETAIEFSRLGEECRIQIGYKPIENTIVPRQLLFIDKKGKTINLNDIKHDQKIKQIKSSNRCTILFIDTNWNVQSWIDITSPTTDCSIFLNKIREIWIGNNQSVVFRISIEHPSLSTNIELLKGELIPVPPWLFTLYRKLDDYTLKNKIKKALSCGYISRKALSSLIQFNKDLNRDK